MLFSHSQTARRMSLLSMLALAAMWSPTTFLDHARADRPGGGGGSPPADPAIAYSASTNAGYRLRVMNADGTNATTIHNGSVSFGGSWSPGGGSIAFNENFSICRIDVSVVNGVPQGSNPVVLVPRTGSGTNTNSYTSPAWSPSGDEIVFAHVQLKLLMTVPESGGTPQTLYTPPAGTLWVNYPAWSPDGAFIAFWEDGGGTGDDTIRILERDTGLVTTAFGPAQFGVNRIDWAQTQDALVFSGDIGGVFGIWRLSLTAGSSPELIISPGSAPSWSPDDTQLVYMNPSGSARIERLTFASGDVVSLGRGLYPSWKR